MFPKSLVLAALFSAGVGTAFANDVTDSPSSNAVTGPLTRVITGTSASNASYSGTLNVSAVPEPVTIALMLAGLGVVAFVDRRRRPE